MDGSRKDSQLMENRKYEEEYSLLEIAKYNLKHWVVLLICALAVDLDFFEPDKFVHQRHGEPLDCLG